MGEARFKGAWLGDLLRERGEASIRHHTAEMLKGMGIEDIELEVSIGAVGAADIVSHSHRLVVETKSRGQAQPTGPGARPGETQRGQLERYVEHFARRAARLDALQPGAERHAAWRGLLTDGEQWWAYEWDQRAQAIAPRRSHHYAADFNRAEGFAAWLQGNFPDRPGKLGLPVDVYVGLLQPFVQELAEIQLKTEGTAAYRTKFDLWKQMLRSSGMLPDERRLLQLIELFRFHTALIAVSRAVVAALDESAAPPAPEELLSSGFASWAIERTEGDAWCARLIDRIARYDWRGLERDALRTVYERMIGPDVRHGFGEYYTPDWLAEAVCEEVLDEDWIARALEGAKRASGRPGRSVAGIGVLDPACGSGTFLFHAARRILASQKLRGLPAKRRADLVARLVQGIDIHPVAVEMSRATLAAALPALPPGGAQALLVHQGDSMAARNQREPLFTFAANCALSIRTPQGRVVNFPRQVLDHDRFSEIVRDLVHASMQSGAAQLDEKWAQRFVARAKWSRGLSSENREMLVHTLLVLHEIRGAEGNHVWEWYIRNLAAPLRIERAKVDRIVANPPWVRFSAAGMSPERQRQLRELADEHGVWAGGRTATRMDLAAVFVPEARRRFLVAAAAGGRSGWVLPAGALRAGQWEAFRNAVPGWRAAWDFSQVREPPFSSGPSCVLFSGGRPGAKLPRARAWKNRRGESIDRGEPWRDARKKLVQLRIPRALPQRPSDYEESCFRQGATLTPSPLLVAAESRAVPGMPSVVEITCRRGSQAPWKAVEPLRGRVERRKLIPALFGENLLPFRVSGYRWVVIPTDRKGQVNPGSLPAHLGKFWNRAERVWGENRKARSPESLLGRIDYQRKLSRQLPLDDSRAKRRVIYNASGGDFLRAARLLDGKDRCLSNSFYHWVADSENEALFLIALLNAGSLQAAYQGTKKAERHFHTHFWSAVPIPKYDAKRPAHRELARAAREAERVAAQVDLAHSGAEERIRGALRESGVMGRIDRAARQILPDHASPAVR